MWLITLHYFLLHIADNTTVLFLHIADNTAVLLLHTADNTAVPFLHAVEKTAVLLLHVADNTAVLLLHSSVLSTFLEILLIPHDDLLSLPLTSLRTSDVSQVRRVRRESRIRAQWREKK